ncbi:MAG: septum formation initiator family protein [Magnetococcales bacterium]|nr:septum formation initiator family protein [Magnetococcales bacterium]
MSGRNTPTPPGPTSKWVLIGLILLGLNAWAQYLLWFDDLGLVRWQDTQRQLREVRQEVRLAEERIQLLKEEILMIEKEHVALEEVARRNLGLVYPDEILFIISEE